MALSLAGIGCSLAAFSTLLPTPTPSAVDDYSECVTQVTKFSGGSWELDCLNPCEEYCTVIMTTDQWGEPGYTCAACPGGVYPPRCCHVVLLIAGGASSAGNCDSLTAICDPGNTCSVQSISSPTKIVYNPLCLTY